MGTIAIPVYKGTPGYVTSVFSTSPPDPTMPMTGPPYDPYGISYVCLTFTSHQIPSSVPVVDLTFPTAITPSPTKVGIAYRGLDGSWSQRLGVANFAPTVHIATVDGVYLSDKLACFALFLSHD